MMAQDAAIAVASPRISRPLFLATAALPFTGALIGPLLPLLIVFAGTLPPTAPQANKPVALLITVTLVSAAALSLCAVVVQRFRGFPKPLIAPLAAVIVTEFVAAAIGLNFSAGLFSIGCQLGGIIFLAAGVIVLADRDTRRRFIACYLIAGSIAALFAMALSLMRQPPAMFAYEHGRASGTFLQPNEFAGYLLFVIPVALAQLAAPRWLRTLGWLVCAIAICGLVLSVSRAAMLSLTCGMVIYVRRFGRRALHLYLAIALVGLLIVALGFRDVAHDPSENASRIAVWQGAARIAQRFALTGTGPLAFHIVYPALKMPNAVTDEVHAHSVPLQMLIETGIVGFAAFLWFVWAAIAAARQAYRRIEPGDREKMLLFTALSAGFAASALQNLIDVVTTFLLIAGWLNLSLLLSLGRPESVER